MYSRTKSVVVEGMRTGRMHVGFSLVHDTGSLLNTTSASTQKLSSCQRPQVIHHPRPRGRCGAFSSKDDLPWITSLCRFAMDKPTLECIGLNFRMQVDADTFWCRPRGIRGSTGFRPVSPVNQWLLRTHVDVAMENPSRIHGRMPNQSQCLRCWFLLVEDDWSPALRQ